MDGLTTDAAQASASVATDGASRSQEKGGRIFFADHLRVALTGLVVIHHLTFVFALFGLLAGTVPTIVATFILLIDQAFFMGAFFLIAGYFTPSSYDRKGLRSFLGSRLVRLLLPLIVYYLLLNPVSAVLLSIGFHTYGQQPLTWSSYLAMTGAGPLWFLEVLFVLGCGYAALRLLRRGSTPGPRMHPAAPPSVLAIVLFTLILAGVTFAFRLLVPVGAAFPVVDLPTPAYLPQYVSLFAVGIVAARRDWFRSIPDRMGWAGLAVSAVATIVLFIPALATAGKSPSFVGGLHWQAAAYALWDSTLSVGVFLGLLVIFRRWANRAGAIWNQLSRSQYGVYVLHFPIVVALSLVLFALPLEPLLKLLLSIVIALPLCFTVAGLVRRIPGVARVL
ncbi:MAG TPA: acyltransferase [Candidatus Dormibacteraeota bacterium]|nr:acyltransferase [Candidatus Dormibacteraeota bacterium]